MKYLFFIFLVSSLSCSAQDTLRKTLIGKWGLDMPEYAKQKRLMQVSQLNVEILDLDDSIKLFQKDSSAVQKFREQQNLDKLVINNMAAGMEKMKQFFFQFNADGTVQSSKEVEGSFTVDEKQNQIFLKRSTENVTDTMQILYYCKQRVEVQIGNVKEKIILVPFDDGAIPPDEDDKQKN